MSQPETLLDVIAVIWRWRYKILAVTVIATIGAIIISLLLPTYFKATTTFYAASEDLSKPVPIGEIDRNIRYYGTDTDIDRLLTIANSSDIKTNLINEFGLYNHYEIDPNSKDAQHKINLRLSKLFKIAKTKLDAIELSIEDTDPELASRIANSARDKINDRAQKTVKDSQLKQLENFTKKITENEKLLTSLGDSLTYLKKKYNVFDLETQTQVLLEQVSLARSKGQTKLANSLDAQIQNYNNGFSAVASISAEHEAFSTQLSIDKEKYRQLASSHASPFPSLHIIEMANTPLIKSRPKRSIYVIGAALFAFLLTTLAALIIDTTRSIKWNDVLK